MNDPVTPIPAGAESSPRSLGRASLFLASTGVLTTAIALVTGPVQARVLGPAGRGLLAAIVVPVTLAGTLAQFGLGDFAGREVARGRRPATVLKALIPVSLASGAFGALALILLRTPIAHGHAVVRHLLLIGAMFLPLSPLVAALSGIATGLARWRTVAGASLGAVASNAVVLVGFAVAGRLTVTVAALSTFGSSLAAMLVLLSMGRRLWTAPEPAPGLTRAAAAYGGRSFLGIAAILANVQLDQILMLPLSSARQLGLYAVAVTMATASGVLISPLASAMFPRVAAGDIAVVPRACRASLAGTVLAGTGIAAICYPAIEVLFGPAFSSAVPMVLILLVASIPGSGAVVLGSALRSRGHPGLVSLAEAVATILTIGGLVLALPNLGGVGAALVSLAAYSVSFMLLLRASHRRLGLALGECLVVRRADLAAVLAALPISKRVLTVRRRGGVSASNEPEP